VLKKRRLVKQQQQQVEETTPVIDETEMPKPSEQLDSAEEEHGQAGSFAVSQDSSEENGDSQMENDDRGQIEYDSDNTADQTAGEEDEEDWASDSNEDNQEEQE